MVINKLIESVIKEYLITQNADGSFPAGHNGPYLDPEKPTRNTAHILYMLASAYETMPSDELREAAERAITYLFSVKARPKNASFYCRDKVGKDHCNGLVGQAWAMEALIKASDVFERPDCYKLAEDVFLLHKWNKKIGIWHRVEIDGEKLSFDGTFNHQLWFAAVAAQLHKTPVAQKQALYFLNNVATKVKLYSNGVIFHDAPMGNFLQYLSFGLRSCLGKLKSRLAMKAKMTSLYSKSVGYHGFNLYAYAMLKQVFPNAPLWETSLIKEITKVCETAGFKDELIQSEYGYFYNVSGIEIAYAMEVLCSDKNSAQLWLGRQWEQTYADKMHLLTKGAIDKNTAMARLYELARLKGDYEQLPYK